MSRVLVVDDDDTVREVVVSYLRPHDVDEADDYVTTPFSPANWSCASTR